MGHTVILHWAIDLITIDNETYPLEEWSDITGLTADELIASADSVEHITIEDEHPSLAGGGPFYEGVDKYGNSGLFEDYEQSIGE